MVRLRKHIDGRYPQQAIAAGQQRLQVAGQRFRVAGYIGHAGRPHPDERLQRRGLAAGPGRVQHHRLRGVRQRGQDFFGAPGDELHIIEVGGVAAGVFHRRRRFLDGDDLLDGAGQQHGESAHPGIGVQQRIAGAQLQALADGLGRRRRLLHIHLKERRGGYQERPSVHRFAVAFLPGGRPDVRVMQRRLNQIVAGLNRRPVAVGGIGGGAAAAAVLRGGGGVGGADG